MSTSHSLLMDVSSGPEQESEAERIASFKSALMDLQINSKPHIAMLTMLAEAELTFPTAAEGIVRSIEQRLHEIRSSKLSTQLELVNLYLIDSICKTVKGIYVELFTQNIVSNFVRIFERGDEKIRFNLFKLRSTWNEVFPPEKLLALDRKIKEIDPKWPIDPHTVAIVEKNKQNIPSESSQIVPNSRGVHINQRFMSTPGGNQLTDQANITAERLSQLTKLNKQKEEAKLEAVKAREQSESCKIQLNNNQDTNSFNMPPRQVDARAPFTNRKRKREKKRKGRQEARSPPSKMMAAHLNSSQFMPQVPNGPPPPPPPSLQVPPSQATMAPLPSGFYSRRPVMDQNVNFHFNNNVVGPWIEPTAAAPFITEYASRRPIEWYPTNEPAQDPSMPLTQVHRNVSLAPEPTLDFANVFSFKGVNEPPLTAAPAAPSLTLSSDPCQESSVTQALRSVSSLTTESGGLEFANVFPFKGITDSITPSVTVSSELPPVPTVSLEQPAPVVTQTPQRNVSLPAEAKLELHQNHSSHSALVL